ncbi:MAG: GAF domain-containing SpoIIE family protein phosphatase [Lysobacterales bacterium]
MSQTTTAMPDRQLRRRARGMPPVAQGVLATLAVLLVLLPAGWFQFQASERALRDEIRSGLARTARIAASLVDPAVHRSFTKPEDEFTPEYAAAIAPWVAARKADPQIAYLYTVIKRDDGFYFIYDITPKPTDPAIEDNSVAVMEQYPPDEVPPELEQAWDERKVVVSEDFYFDQWCTDGCIGGYVPLYDEQAELVGIVGLDLTSGDYDKRLATIREAITYGGIIGVALALLVGLGVWLVRRSDRNTRELERQLDTVNALLNISRALAQKIDVDELMPALISETNAIMRAERCSYFFYDSEEKRLISRVMQGMDSKTIAVPETVGVIGRVARNRRIDNVHDAYADPDFDRSFDILNDFKTRSILAAPVLGEGGKLLGVVQIINKIGARYFDEDDEILLEALTSQMQMAFERAVLTEAYVEKRRLDSALRLASNIQMSMLPTDFPEPGSGPFDLHAILIPAKDVGGDFYDFFQIDDDRWCFVVADVSGKGIPAALFMAKTKALVKAFMGIDPRPDQALARANNELAYDNAAAMFVTVFVAVLNVRSGELVYSNAGHNHPYVLDRAGSQRLLTDAEGVPIGAMMDLDFDSAVTTLAPGEELFLFTDGVNEAMSPVNEQWGDERLTERLLQIADQPMAEQTEAIVASVREHANGAEQSDDITVMALCRRKVD